MSSAILTVASSSAVCGDSSDNLLKIASIPSNPVIRSNPRMTDMVPTMIEFTLCIASAPAFSFERILTDASFRSLQYSLSGVSPFCWYSCTVLPTALRYSAHGQIVVAWSAAMRKGWTSDRISYTVSLTRATRAK